MPRAYYIFQFNIRHPDGTPMGEEHNAIIKENDRFTWKGKEWWHDHNEHHPGDDPCAELDCNVECEIQTPDGEVTGLMDQLCYSYDVPELPAPPVEETCPRCQSRGFILSVACMDIMRCNKCNPTMSDAQVMKTVFDLACQKIDADKAMGGTE